MKTKILTLAILASLVVTGCSKEETTEQPSSFPADGVIRVVTNVNALQTRAGMTADDIEDLNLKIVNSVNTNYSYYAWCDNSDGEWKYYEEDRITPLTMLWQNSTQLVTVTALCRNKSLTQAQFDGDFMHSIENDQSDENSLESSDFLYMPSTEINPAADLVGGKLPLIFKHLLSKVDITVKLGTEFNTTLGSTTSNPITDLKVNGTIRLVKWNASTNSAFDFTGQSSESITAYHDAAGYIAGDGAESNAVAKYECILVPQTVNANNFTVSFNINDKPYRWVSSAAVTLVNGTKYNLTLTAGKDFVKMGEFSSSEWTEGTGGDLETE